MEDSKELKGFLKLNNQAFIELERLELVGMFALISNFISTFKKHDLDDGLGEVWTLIRINQIYETITKHSDKTINGYIDKLIDNKFLIKKKVDSRTTYFRLTDKGKKLVPTKNSKNTKQTTETISVPSEIKLKSDLKTIGEECPECGEELIVRTSQFGDFIGCSNYPKCKYSRKVDNNIKNKINKNEIVGTNENPYMNYGNKVDSQEPPSWA